MKKHLLITLLLTSLSPIVQSINPQKLNYTLLKPYEKVLTHWLQNTHLPCPQGIQKIVLAYTRNPGLNHTAYATISIEGNYDVYFDSIATNLFFWQPRTPSIIQVNLVNGLISDLCFDQKYKHRMCEFQIKNVKQKRFIIIFLDKANNFTTLTLFTKNKRYLVPIQNITDRDLASITIGDKFIFHFEDLLTKDIACWKKDKNKDTYIKKTVSLIQGGLNPRFLFFNNICSYRDKIYFLYNYREKNNKNDIVYICTTQDKWKVKLLALDKNVISSYRRMILSQDGKKLLVLYGQAIHKQTQNKPKSKYHNGIDVFDISQDNSETKKSHMIYHPTNKVITPPNIISSPHGNYVILTNKKNPRFIIWNLEENKEIYFKELDTIIKHDKPLKVSWLSSGLVCVLAGSKGIVFT